MIDVFKVVERIKASNGKRYYSVYDKYNRLVIITYLKKIAVKYMS